RVDFQINYSNLAVQSSQLVSLDQSEFNNCTIVQADETWQRDKKTTDTYTFTNKTGFKIAGLKFPIQIPTQQGASIEYSSEDSTEQKNAVERDWQLSTTIHVPAHVKVSASWSMHEDKFETDYTTVIHPVGMVLKMRAQLSSPPAVFEFSFKV